jgi:phytoene/squalene synthetase
VDTFHAYNKEGLLDRFREDTYHALQDRISLNPILNSFQHVVHEYNIESTLIELFLNSMQMDLHKTTYNSAEIKDYILGSAEVVGLMCLRVFCERDKVMFDKLAPYAKRLGSAFQKVNFLRDLNADYKMMGRMYFPGVHLNQWNSSCKESIEKSIEEDFREALAGIKQLPRTSRLGVYVAYVYYLALFKKIKNTSPELVMEGRIRIPNRDKARLLAYSYVKHQLNMI